MNRGLKQLFAGSVSLLMLASFSACNTAEERNLTERTSVPEEQVSVTNETNNYGERPVARTMETEGGDPRSTNGQTDTGQRGTNQTGGYRVSESVHDTPGTRSVRGSESGSGAGGMTESRRTPVATGSNPKTNQQLMKNIQQLQPGKRPYEYLSNLDKWGTVTEYRLQGNNRAMVRMMDNNRQTYSLSMDINPKNEKVTRIAPPEAVTRSTD